MNRDVILLRKLIMPKQKRSIFDIGESIQIIQANSRLVVLQTHLCQCFVCFSQLSLTHTPTTDFLLHKVRTTQTIWCCCRTC